MRSLMLGLFLSFAVGLVGCGAGSQTASAEVPLALDQWKALPVEQKYEIETFERLKLGEPKLQEQREWDRFMRTVVLPQKKKDGR